MYAGSARRALPDSIICIYIYVYVYVYVYVYIYIYILKRCSDKLNQEFSVR